MNLCSGCGACVGVCPTGALAIDIFKSHKPVINESKCTDCGLCYDVCPGRGYPIVIATRGLPV
ncbi:MAG: 4Fe-4S binding protein [Desulfuromusa sp.]|nr:4Fe-4S binding protein [Desulfuromusa sp.]